MARARKRRGADIRRANRLLLERRRGARARARRQPASWAPCFLEGSRLPPGPRASGSGIRGGCSIRSGGAGTSRIARLLPPLQYGRAAELRADPGGTQGHRRHLRSPVPLSAAVCRRRGAALVSRGEAALPLRRRATPTSTTIAGSSSRWSATSRLEHVDVGLLTGGAGCARSLHVVNRERVVARTSASG